MIKKWLHLICIIIMSIVSMVIFSFRYNLLGKSYSDHTIHISVDDCINIFEDLSNNEKEYDTIFENDTLWFCKQMHERYGAVFSFYCYYESNDYSLATCTTRFRDQFIENSDWLKFNYHAYNESEDLNTISTETFIIEYNVWYKRLLEIVGEESIDEYTRLSRFSGNQTVLSTMNKNGVVGFYTADDLRQSYYFDYDTSKLIYSRQFYTDENNIDYIKTDLRLDNTEFPFVDMMLLASDESDINIEVFTHEWLLDDKFDNSKWKIEEVCKFAKEYSLIFSYNS